jgi:HEAT repeat protein
MNTACEGNRRTSLVPAKRLVAAAGCLMFLLVLLGCGQRESASAPRPREEGPPPVATGQPAKSAERAVPPVKHAPPAKAKADPIEKLLRELAEAREPGIYYTLIRLEKPELNPVLKEAHANPQQRARIAEAIFKLMSNGSGRAAGVMHVWVIPEQLPDLVEFLRSRGKMEKEVIRALAQIKDPRSVEAMAKYFPKHRDAVSRAFQQLGKDLCATAVLAYFHHENTGIHMEARRLTGYFGTPLDAVLDQTLRELKADEPRRRFWACDWLLKLDAKHPRRAELARALESLITDKEGQVQRKAVPALLRLADSSNVPCLVEYLLDRKNSWDRKSIVLHLGKSRDARAVVAVVRELDSRNKSDAREAVKEMGAIAEKEVCKLLYHEDTTLRHDAATLLQVIGTQESVAALKKALDDKHPSVKSNAQKALQRIAERAK